MKKIKMNKKGIFFTIMTIIFLSIFLFYFSIYSYQKSTEKEDVIALRITSIENFIKSAERDIERGLYISSFRAFLSLEEKISLNGTFINSINHSFNELILNGTLEGEEKLLMQESTLNDWLQSIISKANKLNIVLNISFSDIYLYHEGPWHVTIGANFAINANDSTGIAWWEQEEYITTLIPVIGFEDPLYIVNGYGRLTNLINQTPFEGNYVFKVNEIWNVTNLMAHLENMYYTSNSDAPSFLMRFENDLGSSPHGIESLVNIPKLSEQDLDVYDRSCVDYIYFGNISTTNYRINFTPSWFKLDQNHRGKYGVLSISYPD